MSETRSPRDRLRAIRAGRVSQLLNATPADGLPPTEPPRLKLNGKPVTTGAAFDAVMARAHATNVNDALNSTVAKSGDRSPKDRPTYPTGTSPINPLAVQMYQAALKAASTSAIAATSPLYDGLDDPMARQREDQAIRRAISDEFADLSHLFWAAPPANDNGRLTPYLPPELDTRLRPAPADPQHLPNSLPGTPLDDPEMQNFGKTPPLLGESLQALDPVPAKDWDEFNRPQIESIPIIEIDIDQYILKHNSSPETEEDTRYVLAAFKRAFLARGARLADLPRETEYHIPNVLDGTRTGARFSDIVLGIIVDGDLLLVPRNVVDVLKDGLTPSARERRARDGANRNLPWLAGWHSQLDTIPKSRGMIRVDWQAKVDAIAARQVDDLLMQLAKNGPPSTQ
jgi:hypothetical protein